MKFSKLFLVALGSVSLLVSCSKEDNAVPVAAGAYDKGVFILAMDSGSWLFRVVWFIWENTTGKVWKGAHLHPFNHEQLGSRMGSEWFCVGTLPRL